MLPLRTFERREAKILRPTVPLLRKRVVAAGMRTIGTPYIWGGQDPHKGFDCSGLTRFIYEKMTGITLPRLARHQYTQGRRIGSSQLKPGDLVFFAMDRPRQISHVGLYIGYNKFVHAPRTGATVRVDTLKNTYWAGHFKGARRYLDTQGLLSVASLKAAST